MASWFSEHWFDLLQSVGIIGSFMLAAYTTWKDTKARRVGNSIAINNQYRSIWKDIYEHPQLARVLDVEADAKDISVGEELFVTTIIAHLSTVFRAMKQGEFVKLEGLQNDVREFFALPIPKAVWTKTKLLQNQDFAAFIESSLK
jgi:hypothetical protein